MKQSDSHDLNLPSWGPYTKKYLGISHIADQERGLRFDLCPIPGLYRRRVDVPRVTWASGYHPWEASPDLEYFCHRHELEWKDRLYTDISFSRVDERTRLVRCELVNRTDLDQSLTLNFMASLHYPAIKTDSEENLEPGRVDLPEGVSWVDALDYSDLRFARPRPQDTLTYDGLYRGEFRDHGLVGGSGVGLGFGRDDGDRVDWAVPVVRSLKQGALLLRYRLPLKQWLNVTFGGLVAIPVRLQGTGALETLVLPLGSVPAGIHGFSLVSHGGTELVLDGFALGESDAVTGAGFSTVKPNPVPVIRRGPVDRSLVLKYAEAPDHYGLFWVETDWDLRQFHTGELDRFLRHHVHEHVDKQFRSPGNEHFTNVFFRPLLVKAGQTRVVYLLVTNGAAAEVEARLAGGFPPDLEGIWAENRRKSAAPQGNPAGDGYRFSQEKLAATLLTNLVFPVYVQRRYIRHSTPGKWWDCLYTWDSGFIGLGLLELDRARAEENLKVYLTEPDNLHAAFLHHGSPVPVQFALFLELWNRTGDEALLKHAYPRLRRYYRFLAGKEGSSTTAVLKSHLLKTWDYFYNSGGWDDYPAQVHTHTERLEASVTPVISTAQAIRMAKVLAMAADALGLVEDAAEYRDAAAVFTQALQDHAWDPESGYFGYVVHDAHGRPSGLLRDSTGGNHNRGLDGLYPLVAGACTPEQEARALGFLQSPDHLWTDVGLTTVDRQAPYYRIDGYWNGSVWMAHQWYFWKTLLDLGQGDFAWKIAKTALDIWKQETDETYDSMEHWVVHSGRAAGWHQFGGLSSPVLAWFGAYFVPGRLTTGLDTWVVASRSLSGGLTADLKDFGPRARISSVIVVARPGRPVAALWNGEPVTARELISGAWGIDLPVVPGTTGVLVVSQD